MTKENEQKINPLSYFQAQTEILWGQYKASKIVDHRGSKGVEVEKILKNFLEKILPKKYAIGKGHVINKDKASYSAEQDIVIYDAHNCPLVYSGDNVQIFPAESVLAVIEVKSKIIINNKKQEKCDIVKFVNNTEKLREICELKNLKIPAGCIERYPKDETGQHYIPYSAPKPTSVLFIFEGKYFKRLGKRGDLNIILKKFNECVSKYSDEERQKKCPNAIFVLNQGSITWQTAIDGQEFNLFTAANKETGLHARYKESDGGDDTLLIFYNFLQTVLPAVLSAEPDMLEYFDSWKNKVAGEGSEYLLPPQIPPVKGGGNVGNKI